MNEILQYLETYEDGVPVIVTFDRQGLVDFVIASVVAGALITFVILYLRKILR